MSVDPAASMAAIGATAHFDHRLAIHDVQVSLAHVEMLCAQGIITEDVERELRGALVSLREGGISQLDPAAEDVHTAIEQYLEEALGTTAGWIGTARARNDVAVTALRLWIRDEIDRLQAKTCSLVETLIDRAEEHADTLMPGFSHLQVAQPITWGHVCLAYATAFLRDVRRLDHVRALQDDCPLGAGALAGTSFPIDRMSTALGLGFNTPSLNSLESVADRGFAMDFLSATASLSLNLSRFGAEIVFWTSQPVGLITLPDELVTSSSAMPHKRNPDAAELIRGKCGRVLGNLYALQTVVKGLPLSYFRDLQEDKEPLFDSADTLGLCLDAAQSLAQEMQPCVLAMREATRIPFITSSDYAEWLTREHLIPFRESHHLVARLVDVAAVQGCELSALSAESRGNVDPRLEHVQWPDISIDESVAGRRSAGGTAPERVRESAAALRSALPGSRHSSRLGRKRA